MAKSFLCVRDARILGGLTLCVVSGKLHKILAAVTFRPEVECLGFPRAGRVDEVHVHEREDAFTDLWSSASTFADALPRVCGLLPVDLCPFPSVPHW